MLGKKYRGFGKSSTADLWSQGAPTSPTKPLRQFCFILVARPQFIGSISSLIQKQTPGSGGPPDLKTQAASLSAEANADRRKRPIEADIFFLRRIETAIHRTKEEVRAIARTDLEILEAIAPIVPQKLHQHRLQRQHFAHEPGFQMNSSHRLAQRARIGVIATGFRGFHFPTAPCAFG